MHILDPEAKFMKEIVPFIIQRFEIKKFYSIKQQLSHQIFLDLDLVWSLRNIFCIDLFLHSK